MKAAAIRKGTEFFPDFFSVFYHTSFLSRLALLKGIRKNSAAMKGKLLDFGSGTKPYRKLFLVDEYIGVDIEKSGHTHENSLVDVYYDGKTLPFETSYFDSFFSSEVFEHVFNLPEILKEINRVVKPEGNILITIPFAIHEHEVPFDFARYTRFGIDDLLTKSGFKVLKIEPTNNYIEAIFQLWVWYNSTLIIKRYKWLTFIQLLILVAPVNILGWILSRVLPMRDSYYNNLIVVATKI
jgi:SAM-dependent methyltransferase